MFDWHIARVLQRELMDKWHLWGNYTRAHSVWLRLVAPSCWEQLSSPSSLNETTKAVLGIMGQLLLLVPHITGMYITFISHHWLFVEYPVVISLNLRVSGLIAQGKCHTRTLPSPTVTSRQSLQSSFVIDDFFFFFGLLMNMQDVSYLSSSLPNPPFLNSSWPPLLFFMMCSQGERPATPLSWVALNEEKKRGRKILPGPFPNEQINASVLQEMQEGEGRQRSYWDSKAQAKMLTQKQLPHAIE